MAWDDGRPSRSRHDLIVAEIDQDSISLVAGCFSVQSRTGTFDNSVLWGLGQTAVLLLIFSSGLKAKPAMASSMSLTQIMIFF